MSKYILYVLILFAFSNVTYSQSDSAYILPKLMVSQREKSKTVTYSFEKYEHNKFTVNDSLLTANPSMYSYKVRINDIREIKICNGTHFWGGALTGAVFGYVVGFFLFGFITIDESRPDFNPAGAIIGGFAGALPFALIGGFFGAISPKYETFNIRRVSIGRREDYLRKIFNKHKVHYK